jgi:hypothetical protein
MQGMVGSPKLALRSSCKSDQSRSVDEYFQLNMPVASSLHLWKIVVNGGIGFLLIYSFAFGVVYLLIAVKELGCKRKLVECIRGLNMMLLKAESNEDIRHGYSR